MRIEVVAGTGQGLTNLAAFDAAELVMGVGNCNLIRLSSIIPPGSKVDTLDGATTKPIQWGDKLYCIYAENYSSQPGTNIWAGIGWVMLEEDKGLFAEHNGNSKEQVEQSIRDSLMSFMKVRNREPDESLVHMKVTGITCQDQPVCALAMAVYEAVHWQSWSFR